MATLDESLSNTRWEALQNIVLEANTSPPSQLTPRKCRPGGYSPDGKGLSPARRATRALHAVAASPTSKLARSAPDMTILLQNSPSRPAAVRGKADTFNGFAASLDGGDTQIMPSQIYHQHKCWPQSQLQGTDSQEASTIREDHEDAQTSATPARPGTVNIMDAWNTQHTVGGDIPVVDVHSVVDSQDRSTSPDLLSSLRRDTTLKTPGLSPFKRVDRGGFLSPTTVSKTPASATGFSSLLKLKPAQPMMTATQMFENTQDASSPVFDLTRSDPVDSRPSPEFDHLPGVSPSIRPASSPSKPDQAPIHDGPRDFYRPMDESQEQRRLARLRHTRLSTKVNFDLDDESQTDHAVAKRLEYHRAYPSRVPQSPNRAQRSSTPGLPQSEAAFGSRAPSSPAKRVGPSHEVEVIEIADARSDEASEEEDEEEEEREEDEIDVDVKHQDPQDDGSSPVDEYDELGQEVLSSQRNPSFHGSHGDAVIVPASEYCEMEVAGSPVMDLANQVETLPRSSPPEGVYKGTEDVPKFRSGVANAGTENVAKTPSSQPPRLLEPSSMPSYVPGTQLVPLSSQRREAIHRNYQETAYSSMPNPPATSPMDGAGVSIDMPSSPPQFGRDNGLEDDMKTGSDATDVPLQGDAHQEAGHERNNADAPAHLETTSVEPSNITTKSDSNKDNLFKTAMTHVSSSPCSALPMPPRLQHETSESPRKLTRAKLLGDIEKIALSQDSVGSIDISGVLSVMENQDQNFVDAMRSPRQTNSRRQYAKQNVTQTSHIESARSKREATLETRSPTSAKQAMLTISTGGLTEDVIPTSRSHRRKRQKTDHHESQSQTSSNISKLQTAAKKPPRVHRSTGKFWSDIEQIEEIAVGNDRSVLDTAPGEMNEQHAAQCITDSEVNPERAAQIQDQRNSTVSAAAKSKPKNAARVLAQFKGTVSGYFPATCVAVTGSGSSRLYRVQFDDHTETSLEPHHVCAFDLRIGDMVKVYLPGMRVHVYSVQAFEPSTAASAQEFLFPDSNGNLFVRVGSKQKSGKKAHPKAKTEEFVIPVSSIYVTHTMWAKYEGRTYDPSAAATTSRQQTPLLGLSAPDTPVSRSRRHTFNAGSVAGAVQQPIFTSDRNGIFKDCAFAVSFASKDEGTSRDSLAFQVTRHGGLLLSEGLHELFDISTDDSNAAHKTDTVTPFALKAGFQHLGFVALIADGHSRNQKYIQALALSLPTLHYRWVTDSLDAGELIPWARYLLPAGESTFLSGATRSRTLQPYDPAHAALQDVVRARDKLLAGGGVLLLADADGRKARKGKHDRRQVYAFLSLALGAEKFALVESVAEVRARLGRDEGWRWVHCPADVGDAVAGQLGAAVEGPQRGEAGATAGGGGGSKRKRSGLVPVADGRTMKDGPGLSVLLAGGVRVVSDEFVIQSLILGALVDG